MTLVFWRFSAVTGVVPFFITVETRDLAGVTPLFYLLWGLGVVTNGRGLFVLFPPMLLELFLFFLPIFLFSRLYRIVMRRGWLWILELKFFKVGEVLGALGLHFRKSVMRRVVAPGAVGI